MEETTVKMKPTLLKTENKRLQEFSQAAVGHFQNGEDGAGMDNFLNAMEELWRMIEIDCNSPQPQIHLNQLLPALRELYFYMQNQDIPGITELLEYTITPLIEEWFKGCDEA